MTLLKLFNNSLKELPTISKKLENLIMLQRWDEKKAQQAVKIIRQLQHTNLVESNNCLSYNYVHLAELTITLSPSECDIDNSTTFGPENILQGDQYIKDLLTDVNRISEDIQFSLGGHSYTNKECKFSISWEF